MNGLNKFVGSFFEELREKFKCCTVDVCMPEENKVAYTILAEKLEICDGILEFNLDKGSVMSTVFGLYGVLHETYVADFKSNDIVLADLIFQIVSKEWNQNLEDVDLVCTLLDGHATKSKVVRYIDISHLSPGDAANYVSELQNQLTKMRQKMLVEENVSRREATNARS